MAERLAGGRGEGRRGGRRHAGVGVARVLAHHLGHGLPADGAERAHVLLRCTQEIITNAVRHAGASTLWLTIARDAGEARIQARDDGRGIVGDAVPGNGLRGMRERLASCGGQVDIITGRGKGFALDIRLPLEKSA